jgi:hypothetical protein
MLAQMAPQGCGAAFLNARHEEIDKTRARVSRVAHSTSSAKRFELRQLPANLPDVRAI